MDYQICTAQREGNLRQQVAGREAARLACELVDTPHDATDNRQKNYQSGFKKPGKDGSGLYRAVLISGPPGIGKTTSAHLMAVEAGYSPLELNASDARSKKLVENSTNIDNTSLDGFFSGKGIQSTTVADVNVGKRTCLIMDEVDGMSAGDRGGVGALNALIKKTRVSCRAFASNFPDPPHSHLQRS